ncbi:hypothetical protein [Kineococcus sp. SYSU DK001]|uniref:hypothetical protein n=1 Tax=Kineococcus sp. SYSU DK001 TaxID=3383122 RepID=UPI003D7DCF9D
MSPTGTSDEPFDPGREAARRRRSLVAALAELDEAVELERARVHDLPGLPVAGSPREVTAAPVGGHDLGAARQAARRLGDLAARRDALAVELRGVDLAARSPEECAARAVTWLNGLGGAEQLRAELRPDPGRGRPPLGRPPLDRPPFPQPRPDPVTLRVAAAVLAFRDAQPGGVLLSLTDLQGVRGVTAEVLRHLLHTGRVLLEEEQPEPEPEPVPVEVAVLLPLRIETRFKPGTLLLRVVPDEPWFTRHDDLVSEGELTALGRYLEAAAQAPDEATRGQAWRELAGQVGAPRAAFLVRSRAVARADGTVVVRPPAAGELRTGPTFPRIEGFPETLTVWLARGGAAPVPVLTLPVDRARLLADFPDPEAPADRRWWESWDEAVRAGLAGTIPLDGDPDDIDVLYVTGLGDGDPAALFRDQADDGRLAVLAPGTATNTVEGAPAAPLGTDPDTWWEVLQSAPGETDRVVSAALTGDPELLGHLPGSQDPHQRWNSAMVAGLWPALWGFAARDVWALPRGADDAPSWARHALFPEGPYPTLRVGQQPYGLLPASALSRWVPGPGDPPLEAGLLDHLRRLREAYRDAAERRGTVDGATTEQLLDLIGQVPASPLLRHRCAWPLELWWYFLVLSGSGLPWEELDRAWHDRYPTVGKSGLRPARRYGTTTGSRRLELPLVVPPELPGDRTVGGVLADLVGYAREIPSIFARTEVLELEMLRFPPDSLLLRLAVRSLQVAIGDRGRALLGEDPPGPEPVVRDAGTPGRLQRWIESTGSDALRDGSPEAERFELVADGLRELATMVDDHPDRAARALTATVDTAALRIDPWLTGLPARRLQALRDRGATSGLGAYGWVDRPCPGTPGPTAAGLLHAPSPGQAVTAAILRDRAVNDPADHRWDLDLTSRSVRDADAVAEHVRVGAHPGEAVGREVERVVGDPAVVARLRREHPLRSEHAGRRVCDGLAVLDADPATLGLTEPALAGLARLRAALDTYGDVLVAEAVHHVTEGRPEVAGAVMDAAAGLSRPPHLGLLRTPREGRAVTTSVVLVLPDVAAPADPPTGAERALVAPAAVADPAAAAWLARQVGEAADWVFEVAPVDSGGVATGAPVPVPLADLGLAPADALALPRTDLERLAATAGAVTLGADPAQVAVVGGDAGGRYEAAARLVALVGRRPAGPDAVVEDARTDVDLRPLRADVLARYTRLRSTATLLRSELDAQLAVTGPDGGLGAADAATLDRLVRAARAWGVAPEPAGPPRGTGVDPGQWRLVATAARARDLLAARVTAAPSTDPPGGGEPSPAAALAPEDLLDALAALVSPTGQVAVTGRLPRADLPAMSVDPALATAWLPTVSAVRETLAHVDVHRLAAGTAAGAADALALWTTKPGDVWQRAAADARGMVVACADPTLDLAAPDGAGSVAVGVVDRFAEVVPSQEQTTGAAFGFDAPAARAPQAVLLAVPPDPAAALDEATLVDVVADVRLLARVRTARLVDLGDDLRGLLPTSLLPATGATAVPLEPTRR